MRKSLLIFITLLLSCAPLPAPNYHPWAASLRALDPADAVTPANDITAVYLRQKEDILQIRVDVLDFKNLNDLSIDIRIEDDSTPQSELFNIHVPSKTESTRISLDPLLATIIIEIPTSEIFSRPRIDISTPEDKITGLKLDGSVPTGSTPLLLTFYDTFAGRFPAEALRSWDGAHTGPRGERHGLKHLLDAVKEHQIPIALLDLKEPESLSALDAMGVLQNIEAFENQGLLILPENGESDVIFAHLEDASHLYQPLFSKIIYIPIATETDTSQPTPNGPPLEVRRALLETALNADKNDLLVLGGSLQNTTWGSPDMVNQTMAYFASRPYIHILNAEDLREFPTKSNNAIISQPIEPADEQTLQTQSTLEFAQDWAEKPPAESMPECRGIPKQCMLANREYLAILDSRTASLTYLFTRNDTGLHQLIGPSWQVASGITSYPGAFADNKEYELAFTENSIVFKSSDGTRIKSFRLNETGLDVEYQTQQPVTAQIPLLVDPDTRFTPGWAMKYVQQNTPGGIAWGLQDGQMVTIQFDGEITLMAFNQSLSLLSSPEDPDFAYPPGHYVPFPMAIVEVQIIDGVYLRLARLP